MTDAAIGRKVLQVVRDSTAPVFVFALTMETHGPWSFRESAEARRYRLDGRLGPENTDVLEGYVHRLPSVERLAETLQRSLGEQDRPFVFSLFGDHLLALFDVFIESGFEGGRGSIVDPLFETPYFVVGNASSGVEPGVQDLDVSLLGSLGLDVAGLGGDEAFRMSSSFRELCGGRVESCRAGDVYPGRMCRSCTTACGTTCATSGRVVPCARWRLHTVPVTSSNLEATTWALGGRTKPGDRGRWNLRRS